MMEYLITGMLFVVSVLLILGGLLAFTGGLGLLRLSNFYQRTHAPSLPSTLGIGCVLIASMLFFSVMGGRFVLHELLITMAVLLSAPVSAMMLNRAAIERDRRQYRIDAPAPPGHPIEACPTGERNE